MSILVTGGCGYVGKCIVKYLINLEQVKKVIILDVCELSDSDLVDHNKIVFIKADITVTSDLEKAFEGHNIEGKLVKNYFFFFKSEDHSKNNF